MHEKKKKQQSLIHHLLSSQLLKWIRLSVSELELCISDYIAVFTFLTQRKSRLHVTAISRLMKPKQHDRRNCHLAAEGESHMVTNLMYNASF